MEVVLFALNGSYAHTSLAIRCLRHALETDGFTVRLLERNLRDRSAHILQDLVALAEGAAVVGFSCYIWNIDMMLALAQDFHGVRPDCRIVFGGPEVSFDTERFDGCEFIDAILCGEGEENIVSFCRAVKSGTPFPRIYPEALSGRVMQDEGILYRPGDYPEGAMLYYESARGCPYRCSYCLSSVTHGIRAKSTAQVLADLRAFEQMPDKIKIIKFVDRTFNFSPDRACEIWEALCDDAFTKNYHFEVCASLLNEKSLQILRKMPKGKIQLEFGLQSTYGPTLAEVSRHIDPVQVLENVRRIHEMGNIHVHLDLIAGLPYETYARFAQSFDDAYFCCDLLQLGFLKLLHGTALRRRAAEFGYVAQSRVPYTVLATKWVSFSEMSRLSNIAETLERYRESGKFEESLHFICRQINSPFSFYEGLTDYIQKRDGRRLQKISQADAYRLLYEYASEVLPGEDMEAFSEVLHRDFRCHEVRKAPGFMRDKK